MRLAPKFTCLDPSKVGATTPQIFCPPDAIAGQRASPISETTMVAMHMNNGAVEMLAAGQIDDAICWARAATRNDARLLAPYNTLGVIHRRHGPLDDAADQNNTNAISNLATVFKAQGKSAEASPMHTRLASLTRSGQQPPFASFNRGLPHMQVGSYPSARHAFALEPARDPCNDEVNFRQACALVGLGELKRAGKHLSTAIEDSTVLKKPGEPSAKLHQIRSSRRSPLRTLWCGCGFSRGRMSHQT